MWVQQWSAGYYVHNSQNDCENGLVGGCGLNYYWYYGGGCYYVNNSYQIGFITTCSDRKIKQDIESIENGLELILQLEPVEFDWNQKFMDLNTSFPEHRKHSIGFIAQEVEKLIPEVVHLDVKTGYYKIDYPRLNAIVVEAIKEHQVFIDDINKQILELEKLMIDA
jgi:hypothetical protein